MGATSAKLRQWALSGVNRLVRSRYVLPWLAPATRTPRRIVEQRRYGSVLADTLAMPEMCKSIALNGAVPAGYGIGMSERVVEFPWLMGSGPSGRVLDAGSTLNRSYVLDALLPHLDRLDIVTLAPEYSSFVDRGVSYVWADLRELPLRSAYYDCVTCLSTIEHVGMDNSPYGANTPAVERPNEAMRSAMRELRRVLRPGGSFFLTVPYGRRENIGWLRQFNREDLEEAISAFGASDGCDVKVFAYGPSGWRASNLDDAADAVYANYLMEPFTVDGAEGARAVACVHLQRPSLERAD
jgi:SAM-dependent methyltransferase